MRIKESIVVSVPAQEAWDYLADLDNYLHFMSGITRWEAEGELRTGMGARRRMLIRAGSAEVGGLIEFVEWDEPNDLAWTSISGIDQRGRIRLRPATPTATRIEMRFAYGVAGSGIPGWIAEKVAAPTIRGHLRRSIAQLKRQLEHEHRRRQAGLHPTPS